VAPTRSAVEELQKVGFRDSMTIARMMEDETAQQRLRGNVPIPSSHPAERGPFDSVS